MNGLLAFCIVSSCGKVNDSGRLTHNGVLRHVNPLRCPVAAIGMLLMYRTFSEDHPKFLDFKALYGTALLRSPMSGGFYLTDDDYMAAAVATMAGAYEGLSVKHITVPPLEAFKGLSNELPNYSLRMSALSAAVIKPQVKTLDERAEIYNARYEKIKANLRKRLQEHISIPDITEGVTMPVHDSLQFNLGEHIKDSQIDAFLSECHAHGLPVELFGAKTNARNFINWGFAPAEDPLPKTAKMLARACDVRLPLLWEEEDFVAMENVIVESLEAALQVK